MMTSKTAAVGLSAAVILFFATEVNSQDAEVKSRDKTLQGCTWKIHNGEPYLFCEPAAKPEYQNKKEYRYESQAPKNAAAPKTNVLAPAPGGSGSSGQSQKTTGAPFSRPNVKVGTAASGPSLKPVRALIEPAEMPPREVAAYGIVAFSSRPLSAQVNRYQFVCEAFKATLIPQDELPQGTPLAEQMITYWPIRNKRTPEALRSDCAHLVANYDLKTGLDAINDADKQKEQLAKRAGPFLIAWSPSASRNKPDVLVLVMDLSDFDSSQSFLEIFKEWRQKITDKPELWRRGFDVEGIRRQMRDTLDRYGENLLRFIKS